MVYPCCQPGGGVYGEYFTNIVGNDTIEEDNVENIIENLGFKIYYPVPVSILGSL